MSPNGSRRRRPLAFSCPGRTARESTGRATRLNRLAAAGGLTRRQQEGGPGQAGELGAAKVLHAPNPQPAHKARKENGMKNCNAPENQAPRRILRIAWTTALAVAFTVSLSQPAHANQVTPPPVPANIQVPAGNKASLEGHGVGTQNYTCVRSATSTSGVAYVLFTPQATLFDDDDKEVITHF